MRTDRSSHFNVTTIRPGGYPNSNIPQHVHVYINAPGVAERAVELVFEDDTRLTQQVRADAAKEKPFYFICAPRRVDGVEHCTMNIVLN